MEYYHHYFNPDEKPTYFGLKKGALETYVGLLVGAFEKNKNVRVRLNPRLRENVIQVAGSKSASTAEPELMNLFPRKDRREHNKKSTKLSKKGGTGSGFELDDDDDNDAGFELDNDDVGLSLTKSNGDSDSDSASDSDSDNVSDLDSNFNNDANIRFESDNDSDEDLVFDTVVGTDDDEKAVADDDADSDKDDNIGNTDGGFDLAEEYRKQTDEKNVDDDRGFVMQNSSSRTDDGGLEFEGNADNDKNQTSYDKYDFIQSGEPGYFYFRQ